MIPQIDIRPSEMRLCYQTVEMSFSSIWMEDFYTQSCDIFDGKWVFKQRDDNENLFSRKTKMIYLGIQCYLLMYKQIWDDNYNHIPEALLKNQC